MSKLFCIEPDSRVKATGGGYYYVAITDDKGNPHPHGMKLPDRKKRYLYEHIAKMELHLGRYLDEKTEQVDHKDKDKSNNSISNLELTTLGKHQRDHVGRGNHFWTDSSANKKNTTTNKAKKKKKAPSKEAAQRVVLKFLHT
jgi:hypothetical protein